MSVPAGEPKKARSFDRGIAVFVLLVCAVPLLAWLLWRELDGSATAGTPGEPPAAAGSNPLEIRRLERELVRARNELELTRRAALRDTQPETRASWQDAIAAKEAEVREAAEALARARRGK
jgi:hypothetical protein